MILLALLVGCTESSVEYPYDAPGPYTAGTFESTAAGPGDRDLPIVAWFPSSEQGSAQVRYQGVLPGNAYTDVDPDCSEPRPVLMFSHGYGGLRHQSPFLGEHLASHGWIVVAMEHLGSSYTDLSASVLQAALWRPEDVAMSFDWAAADATLAPCIDEADGYAVSGHSFGGFTTYAVAGATFEGQSGTIDLSDDRAWAGVAWAPWDGGGILGAGAAEIEVPMMTISGALDETTTWTSVQALYNHLGVVPRFLGELPEGGHFTFSPVACTLGGQVGDGCGSGFVDLDVATGLAETSTLAFLEEARGTKGARAELPEDAPELVWTSEE